jgi:hypothetical protein
VTTTSSVKWGIDTSKAPFPVLSSEEPIIRFFSFHDAHPIALTMVLMEKFGTEWIDWESDVLKFEIIASFKANSVSEHNWQKIQAIRLLLKTVGFWKEWHIFEKIIHALNNNIPRFDVSQRCTISQLMAGVDIVSNVRSEPFEDEVQRYIVACAMDQGVMYLPEPLEFAQAILRETKYKCLDCGTIDTLHPDERCDFCCGRYKQFHNLSFKPSPSAPDKAGRNIVKFVERNDGPVRHRFEELKKKGWDALKLSDESADDVQAAKLMVAYDYVLKRRRELVEQLEELKSWVTK